MMIEATLTSGEKGRAKFIAAIAWFCTLWEEASGYSP
jgi:hypothetical protein